MARLDFGSPPFAYATEIDKFFFFKLSKSYPSPWLLVAALCFQQPKSDVGFAPWRWQPGRHVRSGAEQALGSPASGRAAQSPAILSPCTRCLRQTCLVFIACSRPGLLTGCRTESVNGFSLRGREMNRAVFFLPSCAIWEEKKCNVGEWRKE